MIHLVWIYTVFSVIFDFSMKYSLNETFFEIKKWRLTDLIFETLY